MCGRYASTRSAADLAALFEAVDETAGELVADYNVAPTDPMAIVRLRAGEPDRVLTVARWGLVPRWSHDLSGAARMINARSETVATSRAFARSFAQHRCLVPADGWYEWLSVNGRKQPYFMTRRDGSALAFAGVWSAWGTDGSRVFTFSILTIPAGGDLAAVHSRMPLILVPERWQQWLTAGSAVDLLTAADASYLAGIEIRPVGPAVGDVRTNGPDLVRRKADRAPAASTLEAIQSTLF